MTPSKDPWKVGVGKSVVVTRPDWTALGRRWRNIVRLLANILVICPALFALTKIAVWSVLLNCVRSQHCTAEQALEYKQERDAPHLYLYQRNTIII